MDYIYRVINEQDIKTLSEKQGIKAKICAADNTSLKELFKTINGHVLYGNNKESSWISCSKSFRKVTLHYSSARGGYEGTRQRMAVIKGHTTTSIITKNGLNIFDKGLEFLRKNIHIVWNNNISDLQRVEFDLSSRTNAKKLGQCGFILTKQGNLCANNVLALGYATNNSEFLILNQINQDDIIGLLTPLEIDLLYFSNENTFEIILQSILSKRICEEEALITLTAVEQKLFKQLYIDNLYLEQIVYALYLENKGVDLFSLFATFSEIKRSILDKICRLNNFSIGNGSIVEDELYVVQSRRLKENYENSIMYADEIVNLAALSTSEEIIYEGSTNLVTLAVRENDAPFDENTEWMNGKTVYKNKMLDSLVEGLNDMAHVQFDKQKKR